MTVKPNEIADVLGGEAILGRDVHSLSDLEQTVSTGLPKRSLRMAAERVCPGRGEARRVIFRVVPEATYKRRTRLSLSESERTERLARVIAGAEFVWADRTAAREWLTRPHPELEERTPLDAGLSEVGARQVEELLDRILYGIPV
jgi:putative toxin-antitoxin system antitoxin component (TIGR02293 family)